MNETNNYPVFRRATMADASVGNKKRAWKSLKQILATERTLQWQENSVTCKFFIHNQEQHILIQNSIQIKTYLNLTCRFFNKRAAIVPASKKILRHFWPNCTIYRSTK